MFRVRGAVITFDIPPKFILNAKPAKSRSSLIYISVPNSYALCKISKRLRNWEICYEQPRFCEICIWGEFQRDILYCHVKSPWPRGNYLVIMARDHVDDFEYFHPIRIPCNCQWWLVMRLWQIDLTQFEHFTQWKIHIWHLNYNFYLHLWMYWIVRITLIVGKWINLVNRINGVAYYPYCYFIQQSHWNAVLNSHEW